MSMKRRKRQKREQQESTLTVAEDLTYDKIAKEVLALRQILAPILKRLVSEFQALSLDTIAYDCIDGAPLVGIVPVGPGRTNRRFHRRIPKKIRGLQTEQSARDEGWVTFDVLFYAHVPDTKEHIKFIINIEAQRRDPAYKLLKRAFFYAGRLISSQKEREFFGQDYDSVCKVYSIWLCFYLPKGEKSAINRYRPVEEPLYGDHHEAQADYDLINVITVYVGDDDSDDVLLRFLRLVFLDQITEEQKVDRMKTEFGIDVRDDTRKV